MKNMISIIIPLYNKEKSVVNTINSILIQDFEDYEIIVVDDGSTDNGFKIVREINSEKIKLYKKENGGPSSARNFGVQKSCGEWIIFIDADDTFESNALNVFSKLSNDHKNCSFFCCNHYRSYQGEKQLFSASFKNGYIYNNFFAWNTKRIRPRAGAAMFHKSVLKRFPFNEKLHRYEDAECIFNIMRNYRAYTCAIPVMTYNCNSAEASKPRSQISEDYIGHLSYKGKGWWEQLSLFKLYEQGCIIYPKEMQTLYKYEQMHNIKVKICNRILWFLCKIGYMEI